MISGTCAGSDVTKCQWDTSSDTVSYDYGPVRTIGDVMYNCSAPRDPNNTQSGNVGDQISDTRDESTSLEESISLKASLSFLDLAGSSVTASVNSTQATRFGTTVATGSGVQVDPGYYGYNSAKMLSINVTGSAYVTQGIKLIRVDDITLTYPSYQLPGTNKRAVWYYVDQYAMSEEHISEYCPADVPRTDADGSRAMVSALGAIAPGRRAFRLTVCTSRGDCARRPVSAIQLPPNGTRSRPPSPGSGGCTPSSATGRAASGSYRPAPSLRVTTPSPSRRRTGSSFASIMARGCTGRASRVPARSSQVRIRWYSKKKR